MLPSLMVLSTAAEMIDWASEYASRAKTPSSAESVEAIFASRLSSRYLSLIPSCLSQLLFSTARRRLWTLVSGSDGATSRIVDSSRAVSARPANGLERMSSAICDTPCSYTAQKIITRRGYKKIFVLIRPNDRQTDEDRK
jgi:hypothetical protein